MTRIVLDIGGTHVRIGRAESDGIVDIEVLSCSDFSRLEDALSYYLEKFGIEAPAVCMAIASPSRGDRVTMTNLDWSFSRQSLQRELKLSQLYVINDYQAMSLAIPCLKDGDFIQVGGGSADASSPAVVCGPGTGLGVGLLLRAENRWMALPGEGGHMDFAPNSEYEQNIWRIVHRRYGHVSAERLISGPGLEELYRAVCEIDGIPARKLDAAQINGDARNGSCQACTRALRLFCGMLGSFCGSLSLAVGAFGGVYIAGGMVPRFLDFLQTSDFRARFEDKGRYRDYNRRIPTFVITAPFPGLTGAAAYLDQRVSTP